MPGLTPFQTVGPYSSIGLTAGLEPMTYPGGGSVIVIRGRLVDGAGQGIPDGVLEFWHPMFTGIGRVPTGDDGVFALTAMKPMAVDGPGGARQAPHFAVRVLGRGILTQYLTRVYLADEPANAHDPILAFVPPDRRETLIAQPTGAAEYRFDVILQGASETVFFEV
jgi:protocatechuate 3,4-dioxygenase, alpha subunit